MSSSTRLLSTASALTLLATLIASRPVVVSVAAQASRSPAGRTVTVSSEPDLQQVLASLTSNTTIVLTPGTYALSATLTLRGPLENVGLRGATGRPGDVVLTGGGMMADQRSVPHGVAVTGTVRGLTIADLTIREVAGNAIQLEGTVQRPVLRNLILLNVGQAFIRAGSPGGASADGVVEGSTLEFTTASTRSGTAGIEIAGGARWVVRGNLFRNVKAPPGQMSGPAVLAWQGSRDTLVEGNTFINCQREIAFGQQAHPGGDHAGGAVRNNFVYRDGLVAGDAAIQLVDTRNTAVLHNTVLASGTASAIIEYRSAATTGVEIRNNLLDGPIVGRDGARGTVESNHTQAAAEMFVNAPAGDLHLRPTAGSAIDAAPVLRGAPRDRDGDIRPLGRAADYGADEVTTVDAGARDAGPLQLSAATTGDLGETTTLHASTSDAAGSGLPPPWARTDVGSPLIPGAAVYGSGYFVVLGAGLDIGGQADQFHFAYRTLEGDGEIIARVELLNRADAWGKAGVMIRDELTGGARHAFVAITPSQGLIFQRRHAEGANAVQGAGSMQQVPHWLKLKRSGNTFSAYNSADGVRWTLVGSNTVAINRLAYVGLAVTSRVERTLANAVFSGVTVTAGGDARNAPPTVALTSPQSGASFTAPASIAVAANASDADGSVTRVDFYAGGALVGSDTTAPYAATWTNPPAGTHQLHAVAHDDAGATTPSAQVQVSVTANQPPSVTLTAPAANASFTAPASIGMTASASDADGTIAKVEFFAGATLVGTDTSSPYSATWSNAPAGTYTLSAKAWDNAGGTMISAGVNVTVKAANQPPTVSLTSPASGATFQAPATMTLAAQATDRDGTVAWVDFYAGNTLIGSDPSSPYSFTWSNVPAGTYTLKAVARDNDAAVGTSPLVTVTVSTVTTTLPRSVAFAASPDHTQVTSYAVDVFQAGANPATTSPFRSQNVGKPTPVNGDITVDVSALVQGLPGGTYFFTVSATGPGGTSRSSPSDTFVR